MTRFVEPIVLTGPAWANLRFRLHRNGRDL